jgi:uncharacterized protein
MSGTVCKRKLRSSRYNFYVPLSDCGVLYNARTGASIRLAGSDVAALAELLCGPPQPVPLRVVPSALVPALQCGGFLVDEAFDELAAIREQYWLARGRTPMVLTLTTTQDCNLGCYYCYESRSGAALQASDIPAIVDWARERLNTSAKDSIHVDWYGGEPLLNLEFVESASAALQDLCANLKVSYSASIISNGTSWPNDSQAFVARHRIRQVQISFDGQKENHDKRRRYRRGRAPEPGTSSFEQAVEVVNQLLNVVRVDLRFNADRGNHGDLESFIEFCRSRGWFDRPFPCVFQLARISDYSERSDFLSRTKLTEEEFEVVRERARASLPENILDETTSRSIYPLPRTSVCAALAQDSIVVGADGNHYRCGLQVGEKNRPVAIRDVDQRMKPGADAAWWDGFDPTMQPNCSQCSFLPVCWGGCPKKHLEGDRDSLHEQSLFWRKALPQKIAWRFGVPLAVSTFSFSERDQFRAA